MITIIKLYKSTIIPLFFMVAKYGSPQKMINRTYSISILRKIVKAPKSTPEMSLYGEIGELPLDFIIDKKRIMCLRKLLTSKTQVNDITKIKPRKPK